MEIYYESRGTGNYLNARIGDAGKLKEKGYTFQIAMLENNAIPYMMQPVALETDGMVCLRYEINSAYIFERMLEQIKPNMQLMELWLTQIAQCVFSMESYLLVPEDLVMEPMYMFYNAHSQMMRFIYIPGYERDLRQQLKTLFEYMIPRFDARDREGIQFLYELYDCVCREDGDIRTLYQMICLHRPVSGNMIAPEEKLFVPQKETPIKTPKEIPKEVQKEALNETSKKQPEEISEEIWEEKCDKENRIKCGCRDGDEKEKIRISPWRWMILSVNAVGMVYMILRFVQNGHQKIDLYVAIGLLVVLAVHILFCCERETEDEDEAMREYEQMVSNMNRTEMKDEWGTEISDEKGIPEGTEVTNTAIISSPPAGEIHKLVPLTNGMLEDVTLDPSVERVIVGRDKKDADYRLPTTQISRVHACLYRQNMEVYIEDRDSTNGTYVNSMRIPAMELIRLNKGDVVSFANEEFFVS